MIKLIAIDLDGTLYNSKREISDETKEAIAYARAKGVHVVLCSGRPIKGVQMALEALNLVGEGIYCISFNGGLVQETGTKRVIAQKQLTVKDAEWLHRELFACGLPVNFIDSECVYEPTYPSHQPSQYGKIGTYLTYVPCDFAQLSDDLLFGKAVSCCNAADLDAGIAVLPDTLRQQFNFFKSRPELLEILPTGVDKAFGVKALCAHLNIAPEEVMAIGDEENDLAMIHFAKYGIAMGNATAEVKAAAYAQTATNDENGVAQAIKKWIQ